MKQKNGQPYTKQQVIKCLLLLLACLLSRMVSAIFYIEDIDSLRFALAVYNYDVVALQPHFPGYFFYFMLIKPLFLVVQNLGISYALMGGVATFIIIVYSYKIYALLLDQEAEKQSYSLGLLLLFNPLLLLMSTRYMPDIFGLALLMSGSFYFLNAIRYRLLSSALLHVIIMGLQCGLRLSYIPFWLPSILLAVIFFRQLHFLCLAGLGAVLFWLLPMLWDTGWESLLEVSQRHSVGHFTEWGGTVMANDRSYIERLVAMLESIWADGLGGYWLERHWLTAIWSLGMLVFVLKALWFCYQKALYKGNKYIYCVLLSLGIYTIWAYFFQNIVYKPRHIMPLIPFAAMIIAFGADRFLATSNPTKNIFIPLTFGTYILVSSVLAWQHKSPSSISQIKQYLMDQHPTDPILVLSPRLINFYFQKHTELKKSKINCFSLDNLEREGLPDTAGYTLVYSTQNIDHLMGQKGTELMFYHNPYVNRLWSQLVLYQYTNQKNNEINEQ
ncbi:hypothetical protein [Aureispira anguillae]|uniref:Glycosyltransferase RgtA/B/C/D-like domain-containing protein n=1 Tax=Aureispira anguillae TaxID=2864201 RepID=A0A916DQZ3_9BACT|nr:hypothetical protein [Aureispira anguillae]BDS10360.1 hypothetical protein AsAng_0010680 [Aureispira anguillae]